jgi:phosphocarrier protein
MLNRELKLVNRLGLHARPSAQIVNLASRFRCSVALICNDRRADARQILAVMLLAASMGATIKIEANGPDEADAVAAITQLINSRFGETE